MSFEPINIKIDDLKLFADVAFAIDSPYFIKGANDIRKKYEINSPLENCDYLSWVQKNLNRESSKKLFKEIEDLRFEMNLTVNYHTVFDKAIFGCDIQVGDYESTFLINFQDIPEYFLEYTPKSELYGIVLTPQTRLKDVQRVFSEYNRIMQQMKKDEEAKDIFNEYVRIKKAKITDIKMVREWYWIMYRDLIKGISSKPKKYREVLDVWNQKCPGHTHTKEERCPYCIDQNLIEKLLPKYREKLVKG